MNASKGIAANQTLFHLTITGIDFSPTVLEFYSTQHALCGHYQFIINITPLRKKEIEQCLGKRATLSLKQQTFIHGYITQANSNSLYLASPLYCLTLTARSKVYRKLTLPELINTILTQNHILYECRLNSLFDYPVIESYTQYNESDFDFLMRHLFRFGFIFYFEQSQLQAKLIMTDEIPTEIKRHFLPLIAQTGMVTEDEVAFGIQSNLAIETNHICLNNYDEQNPTNDLFLTSQNLTNIPGHGVNYYYGESYTNLAVGNRLLTIRQQYLDSLRFQVTVKTTKCDLQPGDILQITGSEAFTFASDGCFRILSIEHKGNQQACLDRKPSALSYFNHLTLIEVQKPYRPPFIPLVTANYQIATIENVFGELPYLDEQGRYHIRYPYDFDTPKGCGSHAIRMLQPHSGSQGGNHWPINAGTQVVIGYINGDIDRPIIIGILPHTKMPGPVTNQNSTQHILRTRAGHNLIMEDNPKQSYISLSNTQQTLHLESTSNQQHIKLTADKGDILCEGGQNICVTTAKTLLHKVGSTHSIHSVGPTSIVTQEGNMTIQCQRVLHVRAKKSIHMTTEQKDINLQSSGDTHFQTQHNVTVTSNEGSFFVSAEQGHLQFIAQNRISLTNHAKGAITITHGQSKITLDRSGMIHIQALRINIKGQVNLLAPETIFE